MSVVFVCQYPRSRRAIIRRYGAALVSREQTNRKLALFACWVIFLSSLCCCCSLLLALFSPLRHTVLRRGFLRRDHHASVGEKCDFRTFLLFSYVCKCVCFNNLQLFLPLIYLLRDMGILWAALRLINFLFPISYVFTVVR